MSDWEHCKSLVEMLQEHINDVDSASTKRDIQSSDMNQRSIDLVRKEIYTAMFLQFVILVAIVVGVSR